jgi:4a-hydroxytetrahydrobiopterin dehydratase
MELTTMKCVACEGTVAPLNAVEAGILLEQIPTWIVATDTKSISKQCTFPDFATALAFVHQVGAIAESEGHHPDITLGWGKVGITLTTHAIGGLSQNDCIVAAKIDAIA